MGAAGKYGAWIHADLRDNGHNMRAYPDNLKEKENVLSNKNPTYSLVSGIILIAFKASAGTTW